MSVLILSVVGHIALGAAICAFTGVIIGAVKRVFVQ